jgi:hypothetical protein
MYSMMGDQLTDSSMRLAHDSTCFTACTNCHHINSSTMPTEVRTPEVVHLCTQLHGFVDDVPYGDREQLPLAHVPSAFNQSTVNRCVMLQTGQHNAPASCALGSMTVTNPALPVIVDELDVVDIRQLIEKMPHPATCPFNGCRMSNWAELPGRPGSVVRLREVANLGAGLAFFSWANHRRMQYPAKYDIVMDFENHTVPGGPYIITLEPTDALVWCPAKYLWPACVLCGKFLFPCDAHRCSQGHVKRLSWWWPTLISLQSLEANRRSYLLQFVQKNLCGLANPW